MSEQGITKLHEVLAYTLDKVGRDVGTIELVKLIYLIDVEYYRLFGVSLTGLKYIRHQFGPYTSTIASAASDLAAMGVIDMRITKSKGGSTFPKKAHRINSGKLLLNLKPEEEEVIKQVLNKIGELSPKQLENLAYKTEPMLSITNDEKKLKKSLYSTPIDFDSIDKDKFMEKWLENRKRHHPSEDVEYEQYLLNEKKEIARLLSH